MTGGSRHASDTGSRAHESLYPFLYSGRTDLTAVLAEARRSTVAKAAEIMELRRAISARDGARLRAAARDAAERFAAGGRLLVFGNGGSATDAQQLATTFLNPGGPVPGGTAPGGTAPGGTAPGGTAPGGTAPGGTAPGGTAPGGAVRPLPALCLASDTSVVTALANDVGVEVMFARQIAAFGRRTDIAVGMSTSGNSENLLRAFDEASRRGLLTVGIAGYEGGKMAELDSLDYLFVAPSSSVHRIQEAQTTIYHVWWELTLAELGRQEES